MSILSIQNISFRYTDKPVLCDVSFDLDHAQLVAVIGPNGSGKTTLLKVLNATLFPNAGRVLIEGRDTSHWPRQEIARTVAIVPQESPAIFPFFAEEIVLMGRFPYLRSLAFENKKDYTIVHDAMARTDSLSFARRRFNELSAGERQRVLIARALAQEPKILLLDESTVFLDLKHQAQFLSLLRELNRERQLTVIFVTHDVNLAAQNADAILLLYNGKKYAIGTPADVLTASNIKEVYDVDVGIDTNPHNGSPRITLFTGQVQPFGFSKKKEIEWPTDCPIEEAGVSPALPRNCKRNEIHMDVSVLCTGKSGRYQSLTHSVGKAWKVGRRKPGDFMDGLNHLYSRGGKETFHEEVSAICSVFVFGFRITCTCSKSERRRTR